MAPAWGAHLSFFSSFESLQDPCLKIFKLALSEVLQ
jgi:hypothetical protein